ncbi:E3 ubiquitin-protein ligase DCST1 isoform X1 [Oryzias melastigma]|uniref:E3 ubiquitin-protein ligase DCST1 isoform X1 n=1 Tax=Oryzias melastigma TaxID=30732 RepID=UPI000CF7BCC9|nr:E3 ubiquitin-protein ligase DCST1 isoform X1 [Oryzias melastigma]
MEEDGRPGSALVRILALVPTLRLLFLRVRGVLLGVLAAFPAVRLVLRGLFGGLSGAVLFLGFAHSLPLTFDLKLAAGFGFVGLCVAGAALSSYFRCSVLLVFPSMLGSRGRTYLMILVLSVLFKGPIANIQKNVEAAAFSLSCNLDLQVHNGKLLWKHAIRPFILVTEELMGDQVEFESETRSISQKFQNLRDEMVLQYGYEGFKPPPGGGANSTQEQFDIRTKMQCDSLVNDGVQRCAGWFDSRWKACMAVIPVPVINHILCVSMKFHFLCDIMKVMTPWCREKIPVEGNFGQLFDQLNVSVDLLSREFSTKLVVQEEQQQSVLEGAQLDQNFTQAIKVSFLGLMRTTTQMMNVLQMLLSFTFISIFIQAFEYIRCYRSDICFDNVYITSYFRLVDARRRKAGKHFLLPLKKTEKNKFIDPWSPRIHQEELRQVMAGAFHVVSLALLVFILLSFDFAIFHVMDIVSRHTVTQFNLISHHQVDIRVGGDSMISRLLRTTISAFNSSSNLNILTDNQACMPPHSPLSAGVYLSCVGCVLLAALFTCLQVYTNRLRRAIAAFYHPEREQKRVLFLYNLQLHRRTLSAERTNGAGRGHSRTVFQRLTRWGRRLFLHQTQRGRNSEQTHYAGS